MKKFLLSLIVVMSGASALAMDEGSKPTTPDELAAAVILDHVLKSQEIANDLLPFVDARYKGMTPLQSVVIQGNVQGSDFLLARNAHVDATIEPAAETSLMIAARLGHSEVLRVLMKYLANPFLKNRRGETPLTIAQKERKGKELLTLLEAYEGKYRSLRTQMSQFLIEQKK